MNKLLGVLVLAAVAASITAGCGYAGVSTVGADKVVVLRNDGFLFGALRKAFVCKVSDAGLASCNSSDAP
jgi:hypothetical protein